MKKIVLWFVILTVSLSANIKMDTYELYKDKKFSDVCTQLHTQKKLLTSDEELLSIYGFSCLNSDRIDALTTPITYLKNSKESRTNAAYFSVLLMQKQLLMHALIDQYDLKAIKVPTTTHILSIVFDLYTKDTNTKKRRRYNYMDPHDSKRYYRLYITKGDPSPKMVIEEYYDKIMTQRHIYW